MTTSKIAAGNRGINTQIAKPNFTNNANAVTAIAGTINFRETGKRPVTTVYLR
jgi:hypothetical protein